jgi:hypothetical protein
VTLATAFAMRSKRLPSNVSHLALCSDVEPWRPDRSPAASQITVALYRPLPGCQVRARVA